MYECTVKSTSDTWTQSSLAKDSWVHIRHASSWMSFQTQAGKLKSHSGPPWEPCTGRLHNCQPQTAMVSSQRQKKSWSAVFWLQPGHRVCHQENRLIQVNTSTDTSHMAMRRCCQVLVSLLPVSYKLCSQNIPRLLPTLPANSPAQKSTAEDVLRIISTRKPRASVHLC